jgi:glycosyltransferase
MGLKVTLITATLNSEKYLEESILSVIGQTYKNIEHIVVDGKSTDKTLDIVRKYEHHLARWISETDRGMYDAINKGMELATGDVIGVLHGDDILASSNVIETIAEAFEKNQVDTVYGDLEYVDSNDINKIYRIWKGKPFKRSLFNVGWMPAHPTFYIRRELLKKYGNYENHYYSAADYEFMARYLYKYRLKALYIPKLIIKMRRGGQSNSNMKTRIRANRRDYLAMRKNNIPFAFLVSILKPLSKLHQYYRK